MDVYDELGGRLLYGSLLWTAVSLVLTYSAVASGYPAPPIVPSFVADAVTRLIDSWNAIAGAALSSSLLSRLAAVAGIVANSLYLIVTVTVETTLNYIYIAYVAWQVLPAPLNVLVIPLWVAAVIATMVMTVYLFRKTSSILQSFIPFSASSSA